MNELIVQETLGNQEKQAALKVREEARKKLMSAMATSAATPVSP